MNILSLDLSMSNTGVVVFNEKGKLVHMSSISTDDSLSYPIRLRKIGRELSKIKNKYKPEKVIIEQGFSRFNRSTQVLFRVHGLVNYIFWNIEQIYLPSKKVRKLLMNNGNAKKEEVQKYLSKKLKKKVIFEDADQSDAYALGLAYFMESGII